jgi:hypothetical protein
MQSSSFINLFRAIPPDLVLSSPQMSWAFDARGVHICLPISSWSRASMTRSTPNQLDSRGLLANFESGDRRQVLEVLQIKRKELPRSLGPTSTKRGCGGGVSQSSSGCKYPRSDGRTCRMATGSISRFLLGLWMDRGCLPFLRPCSNQTLAALNV